MFITAISSKNAYTAKPADGPNSLGDLSPATFKVEFDEPLKIKNADIELVSCKVAKLNKIEIHTGNNTLSYRLGSNRCCEQYQTAVKPGSYSASDLGIAIANAMNEVAPMNIHRPGYDAAGTVLSGGWSSTVVGGEIVLTKTLTPNPTADRFADHIAGAIAAPAKNTISAGYKFTDVVKDGALGWVKFTGDVPADTTGHFPIRSPFNIPSKNFKFCQGMDLGTTAVDLQTRQAVDEFGVWEGGRLTPGEGGTLQAIIRPTVCALTTTLSEGFDGIGPGPGGAGQPNTGRGTYWTFEIDDNLDDDGNKIVGVYENGSLFSEQTRVNNIPRNHPGRSYRSINGVLNLVNSKPDRRGAPYNSKRELYFPYSQEKAHAGPFGVLFNEKCRKIPWSPNWTGQMVLSGDKGPATEIPRTPAGYTFQLDEGADPVPHLARSIVQQDINPFPENVRIRQTVSPLITGLPQQQAPDATITYTKLILGITNILRAPITPAAQNVRYILNVVGQCNYANFAPGIIGENTQGKKAATGEAILPFYKVIKVDGLGRPTEVILCDSGEYINQYSNTDVPSRLKTSLFLNDPNTWEYIDPTVVVSEEDSLERQMFRLIPGAADIGDGIQDGLVAYNVGNRYASFNMGLMNDTVFRSVKYLQDLGPDDKLDGVDIFKLLKNCELDIVSVLKNSDGTDAAGPGQIQVSLHQLQPSEIEEVSQIPGANYWKDNKKILMRARMDDVASYVGTGPAMANWANFPGVSLNDTALLISIDVLDSFTYRIRLSSGVGLTLPFNPSTLGQFGTANGGDGPTTLIQTGSKRAHPGQTLYTFEAIEKQRCFPLHPVIAALPQSIDRNSPNIFYLRSIGSIYNERLESHPWDGLTRKGSNWEANDRFAIGPRPGYDDPAPSTPGAAGGGPLGLRAVLMIKTKGLHLSQIAAAVTPGGGGTVLESDFAPQGAGSLYQSGLHSVMQAQIAAPAGTSVSFQANELPVHQAFLPSFVVEIQNLPLSGFLGKAFDDGKLNQRKGMGSRLPIVGVVPAKQFRAEDAIQPIVNYYYNTSYYQPTQVRLATETCLYSLDINLRDVLSGELLRDLVHNTEVILRIYNVGDKM